MELWKETEKVHRWALGLASKCSVQVLKGKRMVTKSVPTKEMQSAKMLDLLKESSKVPRLVFPTDEELDPQRDAYSEPQLVNLWD